MQSIVNLDDRYAILAPNRSRTNALYDASSVIALDERNVEVGGKTLGTLSVVSMGPVEDRRIVGYVDDIGGVYDAQQRRIGAVGMERNKRYAIQDLRGVVVGSVDSAADASGGHAVYDNFNLIVGTGFADTFVEAATGLSGLIAFNTGRSDHAWLISGAALLLLLHSPTPNPLSNGGTAAFDHTLHESLRLAQVGAQKAQLGVNQLMDEHAQTVADRQRRAQTGSVVDVSAGQRMKTLGTVIVEMIPLGLGPWGIGDVVTFIEGSVGRTLDGLRLSNLERLIYFGASAIPVIPARPVVTIYRIIERGRAHETEIREAERRQTEHTERFSDIPNGVDLNPLGLGDAPPPNHARSGASQQLSGSTGQWETCQIEARPSLMNMRVHFTAEALGPRGTYTAATSHGVGTSSQGTDSIKKQGPTVQELVNKLIAQGWEPLTDRGPYWFSYRFRRRVR